MTATAGRSRVAIAVLAVASVVVLVALALSGHREAGPGTVQGSGVAMREVRRVPAFTRVDLSGALPATVRVGGSRSVVVRGDDNLVRRVETHVRDGRLVVDTRGGLRAVVPLQVVITAPALEGAVLSGVGMLTIAGVRSSDFTAELSGSGLLRASGEADRLTARLSGTGDLRLGELRARTATAELDGVGRIAVGAVRRLHVSVTGTGSVEYRGRPVVSGDVSPTGVVRRD